MEVGHVVHSLVARPHTVEVVVGAVPPLPLDEVLLRVVDIFRLKVGALRGGGGGRAVVAVGPQGWLRVRPVLVGGRHRLGRVELLFVELVDWSYVVVDVAVALEVEVIIRKLANNNSSNHIIDTANSAKSWSAPSDQKNCKKTKPRL